MVLERAVFSKFGIFEILEGDNSQKTMMPLHYIPKSTLETIIKGKILPSYGMGIISNMSNLTLFLLNDNINKMKKRQKDKNNIYPKKITVRIDISNSRFFYFTEAIKKGQENPKDLEDFSFDSLNLKEILKKETADQTAKKIKHPYLPTITNSKYCYLDTGNLSNISELKKLILETQSLNNPFVYTILYFKKKSQDKVVFSASLFSLYDKYKNPDPDAKLRAITDKFDKDDSTNRKVIFLKYYFNNLKRIEPTENRNKTISITDFGSFLVNMK